MNKVVFFHNPQVAAIIPGAPVNCWNNENLSKFLHKSSTDIYFLIYDLNQ